MQIVAARELERHLKLALAEIREVLARANINEFELDITVSGRVHDGDLRVRFRLGDYGDRTQGGALTPVVEEYLRRHGWNERHGPLCLPAAPAPAQECEDA